MNMLSNFQKNKSGLRLALRLGGWALFLVVVAVVVSFLLIWGGGEFARLGYKTIELAIQVFFVVIAGGLFVQEYNRGQARRTALNEFRKTLLRNLIRAYSDTKKVRRVLRARCRVHSTSEAVEQERAIPYGDYDKQLGSINETQLSLEIMARELKVFDRAFAEPEILWGCVKNMENYLGDIIDEYERTLGDFQDESPIPLCQLTQLSGFIAKSKAGTFSKFSDPFRNALDSIQKEQVNV